MYKHLYTHPDDSPAIGWREDTPLPPPQMGRRLELMVMDLSPFNRLDFLVLFGQAKRTKKNRFVLIVKIIKRK